MFDSEKTAVPEKPKEEKPSATDSEIQRKKDQIVKVVGEMMWDVTNYMIPYRIGEKCQVSREYIARIHMLLGELSAAEEKEGIKKSAPTAS